MTDNLVTRLRDKWQHSEDGCYEAANRIEELEAQLRKVEGTNWSLVKTINSLGDARREAADRIEELERHVELRDFFLVENDLWEKFAKGAEGKINE